MMHAFHVRQIERYFAGSLRPAAVTEMFRRLWHCTACRVLYERYLLHEHSLPGGDRRQRDQLWQSILVSANADADATAPSRSPPEGRRRLFRPAALQVSECSPERCFS